MKQWYIVRHYLCTDGAVKDEAGLDRAEARNQMAVKLDNLRLEGAVIDEFGTTNAGEKIFVINDDTDDAHLLWLESAELPRHTVCVLEGVVN